MRRIIALAVDPRQFRMNARQAAMKTDNGLRRVKSRSGGRGSGEVPGPEGPNPQARRLEACRFQGRRFRVGVKLAGRHLKLLRHGKEVRVYLSISEARTFKLR